MERDELKIPTDKLTEIMKAAGSDIQREAAKMVLRRMNLGARFAITIGTQTIEGSQERIMDLSKQIDILKRMFMRSTAELREAGDLLDDKRREIFVLKDEVKHLSHQI